MTSESKSGEDGNDDDDEDDEQTFDQVMKSCFQNFMKKYKTKQ